MLHRIVTAAVSTIALTQIASAADIPVKAMPPVVAPVFNWTGFYVGGNVGGAWSRDKATLSFPDALSSIDPLTVNTGSAAVIGGFQEGFNWQFAPTWVWGIEADWSFTAAGRSLSQSLTVGGAPVAFSSSSLSTKLDWLGSARNRLGYLITPNLMLYGTGGVAWGKIDYAGTASLSFGFIYTANTAFSRTAVGWTAGAGLEWMITEHWLLRGEYIFYDLSSSQNANSTNNLTFKGLCILGQCPPPQATASFSWANMSVNEVRAALSYKF
jgi:outer membrane immunogenic protein